MHEDHASHQGRRSSDDMGKLRVDDWVRWAIGGLVAGLVAYGSVGSRLTSVEVELRTTKEQVAADREASRKTIEGLTNVVYELKQDIAVDRALQDMERRKPERPAEPRALPKFGPQ